MESFVEENNVSVLDRARPSGNEWERARAKAEAYLRAWRLPEQCISELTSEIIARAEGRLDREPDLEREGVLIEEADQALLKRLNDLFPAGMERRDQPISAEDRARFLFAGVPQNWSQWFVNSAPDGVDLNRFDHSLEPSRPLETHPMTMQTSLRRLPNFRIIAGWFILIALIVLSFIFTH